MVVLHEKKKGKSDHIFSHRLRSSGRRERADLLWWSSTVREENSCGTRTKKGETTSCPAWKKEKRGPGQVVVLAESKERGECLKKRKEYCVEP